ncbi:MAG: multicopper polyphenol oxidase [Gemmatimonadetes bacterium]|nr:multicopper polyphenol oxidase [Gemmatimonadota bacterium]
MTRLRSAGWSGTGDRLISGKLRAIEGVGHAVCLPRAGKAASPLEAIGTTEERVLRVRQVHGTRLVEWSEPAETIPEGDGVLVRRPGAWAGIRTADCVPLLLVGEGALAVVHAGWRGTLAGIAALAVGALGGEARAMTAVLGPHIGACCYEVAEELGGRFRERFGASVVRPNGHLGLGAAIRSDLERAGVMADRIFEGAPCTYCDPRAFPSWRREGEGAGRLLTLVGFE